MIMMTRCLMIMMIVIDWMMTMSQCLMMIMFDYYDDDWIFDYYDDNWILVDHNDDDNVYWMFDDYDGDDGAEDIIYCE